MNSSRSNIRIAIPTNDGITIHPKMLGTAKYFYIYELNKTDNYQAIEIRENIFEKTLQAQKTLDVYELIQDCHIILSAKIGKKGIGRLEERGLKLVFNNGNIKDALTTIYQDKNLLL